MRKLILIVIISLNSTFLYSDTSNLNICFLTTINDDNVNVRERPSLDSRIIGKLKRNYQVCVLGISNTRSLINGHENYWFLIKTIVNDKYAKQNWVFGDYIVGVVGVRPSILKFDHFDKNPSVLYVSFQGMDSRIQAIGVNRSSTRNLYYFIVAVDNQNSYICDVPGIYSWNPANDEIKFVSYLGLDGDIGDVDFTDDMKYKVLDYGTDTGLRCLVISGRNNDIRVFSGMHYGRIEIENSKVTFAVDFDKLKEDHTLYQPLFDFGKNSINKSNRTEGSGREYVIQYTYDIETKEITPKNSIYITGD